MKKILKIFWNHKILFLIILAGIGYGGWFWYKKMNPPVEKIQYTTVIAGKGMLVSSISGTGQIESSNQLDISPKVSGDVIEVNIQKGQKVKEGDVLIKIDSRDYAAKVNEAAASLETAELELDELLSPPAALSLFQAENSVASAQSNLDKILEPPDPFDVWQAENALSDAQKALVKLKKDQASEYQNALEDKKQSEDELAKSYEDAYNEISNTFLDLPTVMTGINKVLFSSEIADSEISVSQNSNNSALISTISDYAEKNDFRVYVTAAEEKYRDAKSRYDANIKNYTNISRYSDRNTITYLLAETIETVKRIADTIKSQVNMLDFWMDYRTENSQQIFSKVTQYQSTLSTYTSQTNSHLSSLLTRQSNIETYAQAKIDVEQKIEEMAYDYPIEITSAERTIEEKENVLKELNAGADEADIEAAKRTLEERKISLEELKKGADDIDIKNKKLAIQQKVNALADARKDYENCIVKAPFDGEIAEINIAKGDGVSSGSSIVTLITSQKLAKITLNEIDAAKVKIGQKATITFDAISGLSITGTVAEIDILGSVTQGVVSYSIKIAFDVQDERIKPAMSVSAAIITKSKQNILLVPLSAVKTLNGASYVEILVDENSVRRNVAAGLSNDTMIEIIEGIKEGDKIITQTIKSGESAQNSASRASGPDADRNAMGGMFRIMR